MKIAFIGQKGIPASYGGIERHVEELSTRLVQKGHVVYVYCRPWYSERSQKLGVSSQKYKGVNLIFLPSIKTKHFDAISHTFLATLHALFQNYDVIHYQSIGPSSLLFLPRIFKRKVKILSTLHCPDYEHQKWGLFAKMFLRLGEGVGMRFAHQTISVSQVYRNYLKRRYGKTPLVIPNGVNLPQIKKPKIITKKWGLTKDSYLLVVSRFIRHKGIHAIIKSYQSLGKTDKKLVIVGGSAFTDDYQKYLKHLANNNPNIIFTGYQTGEILEELFSNAYLFLQASESEGLPITLLEALSFGKSVLISDIPENLEAAGLLGFYFETRNIDDLTKKLEYLLSQPKLIKKKGLQAQEKILKKYNWDKITQQTEMIYLNTSQAKNFNFDNSSFEYSF